MSGPIRRVDIATGCVRSDLIESVYLFDDGDSWGVGITMASGDSHVVKQWERKQVDTLLERSAEGITAHRPVYGAKRDKKIERKQYKLFGQLVNRLGWHL